MRKALLLGVSEVRLEHPTRDHGETRSDRRFVGFQLRVFFPGVIPIEFVESQVGDGVISSQRVQRLMQVEKLAARELAASSRTSSCGSSAASFLLWPDRQYWASSRR
jgi:hypothetical protein